MSVPPATSPWLAPTLADAAAPRPASSEPRVRQRRAAALQAARRLVDPTLRAEHAATRDVQRIAADLATLPSGWFRLETVDVDHFVVGPGGVFIIQLQHHLGATVWVNERTIAIDGRTTEHIEDARAQARRTSERLTGECGFPATVQSVLVMIGATVQTVSRPAEVHVRAQHDLRDWLCMQPARLDAAAARAIHRSVLADYERGSSITTGI